MSELPAGTVTFLFTDIEGSTRLLEELGKERYTEALEGHRRVIREAIIRHGGSEMDTQGDAFFVAFPTASGALGAADDAQAELAAGPIRVRMGIHSGEPLLTGTGYVGIVVHRAARIAAAGHGGQVLVSDATRSLLDDDTGLRDLGLHRLKDLAGPQRLHQLGSEAFPPLKTLDRTNLPVPATPFLGRTRELAEVGDLLARADVRLLGAADRLYAERGVVLDEFESRRRDATERMIRDELDPDTLAALRAVGAGLSTEDVIAIALGEVEPPT